MTLSVALMLLAGTADASASAALDEMMTTFSTICLAAADLASQHQAAAALPGVEKVVVSGYKNRERVIPGAHYRTPKSQLTVSIFGYAGAGVCAVSLQVEPTLTLPTYLETISRQFGKKPNKRLKTDSFYRGGWADGRRDLDFEWAAKGDHVTTVMSVRKRDGYSR